jgi:hypothetical protein
LKAKVAIAAIKSDRALVQRKRPSDPTVLTA